MMRTTPHADPRPRHKRWIAGALATAMLTVAGSHGAVEAATPSRGPAVLFSPFYYRNPGDAVTSKNDPGAQGVANFAGLLGPLSYTNPDANDVQRGHRAATSEEQRDALTALGQFPSPEAAAAALEPEGDLYWVDPKRGEIVVAIPAVARSEQGRFFQQAQAEEVLPSPLSESAAIPIPSDTTSSPAAGEQGLAGAESIGEQPEAPRLQFLRAQSVLLEPGELQVDVGIAYVLNENDFPAVQAGPGGAQVVEATFKQRQVVVPLEFRLGVTRRMQAFVSLPVGWANTELAVPGGFEAHENDGGLGDMNVGSSFLLFDGQGRGTDVVFTLAATLPTGDSPFLGVPGSVLSGPTLGDNLWAVSADLLWIRTFDPIVLFYGIGYRHQFDRDFAGVEVNPGEEIRAQLGVGFAVNRNVTLSTRFATSFISRTEFDGESFEGSFSEPMSMRFAATVLDDCTIVEPFAEIGSNDDAASSRFGVVWTY